MNLAKHIQAGLGNDEFFLEYMPTISLTDGYCVGAEALIRWKSGGQIIPPDQFIPQIENTPTAGLLTYWVIETVGIELGEWLQTNSHAHIAINVSPDLIGRGGVLYALQKSGLTDVQRQLVMEITERGLPDQQAIDALNDAAHVTTIAVDDFGTGDLNLVQLAQLPAHIVKIDKIFVDEIESGKPPPKIVTGLTAFAKAVDMRIIAEGVEFETQARVLKELGVDMAQGWYYSRSLRRDQFIEFAKQ